MAKRIKEDLTWVTLDVNTFPPALKKLDAELREGFAMIKEIKARYEAESVQVMHKIAPALDADTKAKLKIDEHGKFPVDSVLKFSYLYGVGVATAHKSTRAASKGAVALS